MLVLLMECVTCHLLVQLEHCKGLSLLVQLVKILTREVVAPLHLLLQEKPGHM